MLGTQGSPRAREGGGGFHEASGPPDRGPREEVSAKVRVGVISTETGNRP